MHNDTFGIITIFQKLSIDWWALKEMSDIYLYDIQTVSKT